MTRWIAEAELHERAAWDADGLAEAAAAIESAASALRCAELAGEPRERRLAVSRKLQKLCLEVWLPRGAQHALTVTRDEERHAWYHTIVGVILVGISTLEDDAQDAAILQYWPALAGFEELMTAPLA